MSAEDIVAIYRKRWEIELLFKQIKQNFPLDFLRRKRQCHQNPDMDNPHRQPSTDGAEETHQTQLELLGIGNNGQNHVNVLRQPYTFPRRTRQRLVKTGSRGRIATQGTPALWIEGLTRQTNTRNAYQVTLRVGESYYTKL